LHQGVKFPNKTLISRKCFIKFFSLQVRVNDLAFYENRTDPSGPAMTHAMFAIGWLEVGNKEKAEKSFLKNYANIQGPFKVFYSF